MLGTEGDPEFSVSQFGERFREHIHAQVETFVIESISQLVQEQQAPVHRAASAVSGVQPRAHPFEVG